MNEERELIRDYQEAVRRAVTVLQDCFGRDDLLASRRGGEIPKEGISAGLDFNFHGIGCRVVMDGVEIDFDFGPNGRTDGFDAWRLWNYAKNYPTKFPTLQRLENVEAGLERLRMAGDVKCPATEPSPHLFYLTKSLSE